MPIEIDCATCQTTLTVPDATAGRLVRCSHCQTPLRVPRPGEPPAAEEPPSIQRPAPLTPPLPKKPVYSAAASEGKPVPATRMVNMVAYACYAVIAIALVNLASGLVLELAVATTARPNPSIPNPNPQHPLLIKAIWATVVILFLLLSYSAVLVPYGLAGYGIQRRRGWARILCLVLAWISICLALFIIGWLVLAAFVSTLADPSAHSQNSPGVRQALIIANFGRNITLTLAYIVHATLSLSILFRSKYAAEFR